MEEKNQKKVRQYRSRQGRSDRQYESSMKVMTYGCGLFLIILVFCNFNKVCNNNINLVDLK